MFGNLINRILGLETDSPGTGRQPPVLHLTLSKKRYHTNRSLKNTKET